MSLPTITQCKEKIILIKTALSILYPTQNEQSLMPLIVTTIDKTKRSLEDPDYFSLILGMFLCTKMPEEEWVDAEILSHEEYKKISTYCQENSLTTPIADSQTACTAAIPEQSTAIEALRFFLTLKKNYAITLNNSNANAQIQFYSIFRHILCDSSNAYFLPHITKEQNTANEFVALILQLLSSDASVQKLGLINQCHPCKFPFSQDSFNIPILGQYLSCDMRNIEDFALGFHALVANGANVNTMIERVAHNFSFVHDVIFSKEENFYDLSIIGCVFFDPNFMDPMFDKLGTKHDRVLQKYHLLLNSHPKYFSLNFVYNMMPKVKHDYYLLFVILFRAFYSPKDLYEYFISDVLSDELITMIRRNHFHTIDDFLSILFEHLKIHIHESKKQILSSYIIEALISSLFKALEEPLDFQDDPSPDQQKSCNSMITWLLSLIRDYGTKYPGELIKNKSLFKKYAVMLLTSSKEEVPQLDELREIIVHGIRADLIEMLREFSFEQLLHFYESNFVNYLTTKMSCVTECLPFECVERLKSKVQDQLLPLIFINIYANINDISQSHQLSADQLYKAESALFHIFCTMGESRRDMTGNLLTLYSMVLPTLALPASQDESICEILSAPGDCNATIKLIAEKRLSFYLDYVISELHKLKTTAPQTKCASQMWQTNELCLLNEIISILETIKKCPMTLDIAMKLIENIDRFLSRNDGNNTRSTVQLQHLMQVCKEVQQILALMQVEQTTTSASTSALCNFNNSSSTHKSQGCTLC